jgi:diguanylate cyclase (GGDEF)-like protein
MNDLFPAAPLPLVSDPEPMGFWDDLFNAVKFRLRQLAPPFGPSPSPAEAMVWSRSSFLECVDALDRLQAAVADERHRRRSLEQDVCSAQDALAEALHELVGTRAGEQRARHLALHDSLTALPNREHFRTRLEHALSEAGPKAKSLAVLYLDLDDFKRVNDEHGHEVGDELLRIVASRLARAVRKGDMVGRLGGDEFAFLLSTATTRQQLHHVAIKLSDAVTAPLQIGELSFTIRPSIGIARSPFDGRSTTVLLRSADAAMYHAKRLGMGYAFFNEVPDPVTQTRPMAPACPERPGTPALRRVPLERLG